MSNVLVRRDSEQASPPGAVRGKLEVDYRRTAVIQNEQIGFLRQVVVYDPGTM